MSNITLSVSAIFEGKFYHYGTPLPFESEKDVPRMLRKYIEKPEPPSSNQRTRTLNYSLGENYQLDEQGYRIHKRHVAKEQAQMQAEAFQQEELEDEIANAPISEATAKALEIAQEDYAADVEREKVNLESFARKQDAADAAAQEYLDEQTQQAKGEFVSPAVDEFAPEPEEIEPIDSGADDEEIAKPPPVAKASKAKSKSRSFVKRNGQYVLASTVELIDGEKLFRHRKREFGIPEK
jgi:hypothetical protein